MNGLIKIGTILCWAIGIGSEYVIQQWPAKKKLLNWIAILAFMAALSGEYISYKADETRQSLLEHRVAQEGILITQWFQMIDSNVQSFTLSHVPIPGSVELLINGLIEPNEIFDVQGNRVTLKMQVSHTDAITIKYRYNPS
jgi:hypothetical protein